VLFATLFFVIETVEEWRTEELTIFFKNFEAASIYFFTAEYFLRLFATAHRLKFVYSIQNLIDLGAIIPFYVTLALQEGGGGLGILRIIRLTRVFRVIKLGKSNQGLKLLLQTMSESLGDLSIIGVLMMIAILLFGSIVQMVEHRLCEDADEGDSTENCQRFANIPLGMWWATVTLTTVGYGDSVPMTTGGKLLGSLCLICGVLYLAGPIAVLSTSFSMRYEKNTAEDLKRRTVLRQKQNMVRLAANRGKQVHPRLPPRVSSARFRALSLSRARSLSLFHSLSLPLSLSFFARCILLSTIRQKVSRNEQ
jgi:hypothetical protein